MTGGPLSPEGLSILKCYTYCVLKKLKWMDKKGVFFLPDLEKFNVELKPLSDFLNSCMNKVTATEKCDRAYVFSKCIYDKYIEKVRKQNFM